MKLKKVVESYEALVAFAKADAEIKFTIPVSARCRYGLNMLAARPVNDEFLQNRAELYKKYGEEVKPGEFKVVGENVGKMKAEFDALLDEEVDVKLKPMKQSELGNSQVPIEIIERLFELQLLEE